MISQSTYPVFAQQKVDLILLLIQQQKLTGLLVYVCKRDDLHALTSAIARAGMSADSIHANKKPELRDRAIREFGEGKLQVLLTSEAIARGIAIDGVKNIINYDMPELDADYLLRLNLIENSEGQVITFTPPNKPLLKENLDQVAGIELPSVVVENFKYATRLEKISTGNKGKAKLKSKPLQNKKSKLKNKRGR
ncbi:MAG: helicase-related protein [Akkermansiaceae bacterium]